MWKRTVSGIMLTLLLIGMLTFAFNIQTVKASGTIYIRADGSIDPPTAPISSVDNVTYTFTGNIDDSIVIERDNIIVDGAGYIVHGWGTGAYDSRGIYLSGRKNVTIRNMEIREFYTGIYLIDSSKNHIVGNNITTNYSYNIWLLYGSSNNIIEGNSLTYQQFSFGFGIGLVGSYNNIVGNNITDNWGGIELGGSYNNISSNIIIQNYVFGIQLTGGESNFIIGNRITNTAVYEGIYAPWGSSNLVIMNNNISFNGDENVQLLHVSNSIIANNVMSNSGENGLYLYASSNNMIVNNTITNNPGNAVNIWEGSYNNFISSNQISNSNNGIFVDTNSRYTKITTNIITNNTHYGIISMQSSFDTDVINNTIANNGNINDLWPSVGDAGVLLMDLSYNTVMENIVANNTGHGAILWNLYHSIVAGNIITRNTERGVFLSYGGYNNTVINNTIAENLYGIYLHYSSNGTIYHNNFINNTNQVYSEQSVNAWDDGYPLGGNYWSDYSGVDLYNGPYQNVTGSDGVGDTPYVIDSYNKDSYPFMSQNGWQNHPISIESNTTITNVVATRKTLHFKASGPDGTIGYINITIPMGLNKTEIKVFIDGVKLTPLPFPIITTNTTHYFIYFEFTLSTHNITIQYAIADIAATNITSAKTVVGRGYTVRINATIQNQGDYTETFNITVYANTTIIETKEVTLTSGNLATITFIWNTTGFAKGNYAISVYAEPVIGETDTDDNTKYFEGIVRVVIPGDVDASGKVDMFDIGLCCVTYYLKTDQPGYNPNYDIDGNGKIDMMDIGIACTHYYEKDP